MGVATTAADARERQLEAERGSGAAHIFMLATQDLAEDYHDWAWHTDVVVRDGQVLLIAVADRSASRHAHRRNAKDDPSPFQGAQSIP